MKRKLCVLLAALMVVSVFPACSKKSDDTKESTVAKKETKETTTPETA